MVKFGLEEKLASTMGQASQEEEHLEKPQAEREIVLRNIFFLFFLREQLDF